MKVELGSKTFTGTGSQLMILNDDTLVVEKVVAMLPALSCGVI